MRLRAVNRKVIHDMWGNALFCADSLIAMGFLQFSLQKMQIINSSLRPFLQDVWPVIFFIAIFFLHFQPQGMSDRREREREREGEREREKERNKDK